MRRKWFGVAVLSLAFAGVPAVVVRAADTTVKMRDVPEKVKAVIDRERGDSPVKTVTLVEDSKSKFYRVVIEKKGREDQVIRVSPGGELLSADLERDVRANAPASETGRESGRARPSEVKRANESEGTTVNFDDLPGNVKRTIGAEARNSKVVSVLKYSQHGQELYRATVSDGNRERYIRVKPDGTLYNDVDATPLGGKEVAFDSLPYDPKVAVGKEAGAAKVSHVYQLTKAADAGETHYRIVLDTGRQFDVTDKGKIIAVDENAPSSEKPASETPRRRR